MPQLRNYPTQEINIPVKELQSFFCNPCSPSPQAAASKNLDWQLSEYYYYYLSSPSVPELQSMLKAATYLQVLWQV